MQPSVIEQLPACERFDMWREEIDRIGVKVERPQVLAEDVCLGMTSQATPSLIHMTFRSPDTLVQRMGPQIRRLEWNQYLVYREIGAGAWFDYSGLEFTTGPGDLVIADADTPFATRAIDVYHHHAWLLPRHVLEPHLPRRPGRLVAHIPASSPVAALVVAYLDTLSSQLGALDEAQTALIADNLGRLVAVACGAAAGAHQSPVCDARLQQARRFIDRSLARPDLGPDTVAATLGVSVRQAHLIFEPGGESIGQYIRRRRLEECRAALASPFNEGRSVADIAFAWGFSSLPTFYRAFSQAFDMAPGDVRAQRSV